MIPTAIEKEILIDEPVEVVWGVVTEPAHIGGWFSDSAELELRPGGEGALSWSDHGTVLLRVKTVERPHRFAFRWMYPEGAEPREGNSLLVEFTLRPEGEATRLRVVEHGLAELDWDDEQKTKYADDHIAGWNRHLGDLHEYVARQRPVSAGR
jgi:uncharacterized protein YndB with AHSA1/START domain